MSAPVMFIGEAPGRLGADASAIPFHGDQAGENFENLIEQAGLSRYDCFITNAVLCNPRDTKGNNATPSRGEVVNCSRFLKRQIDLVDPKIVVTLGRQALQALRLVEDHSVALAEGVRQKWHWYGRQLIPLYHPGQRALIHRSFLNQLADYRFVAESLRRLRSPKRATTTARPASPPVSAIVRQLLGACGTVSYFGLHKLFYMVEYEHCRHAGKRMTTCFILRQKDGPYVAELNIRRIKKAIPELHISTEQDRLFVSIPHTRLFPEIEDDSLRDGLRNVVRSVAERYSKCSDAELKRIVYMTSPMRQILRREKYKRENLFNAPVDFSSACR
ncbi:uracil-DNA glycosylase [Methyloceanibacter sp. wino2]|uniref:uracil-DNA glycosylase n=1 Tax=Methyloceanibacter sp. wino2 TaxID=2170729 RepID=UPI001ABA4D68|nr:uracil-DNA glycosylase [Methyloceanibacter sp. wino2]